jgi:hypothetical protein
VHTPGRSKSITGSASARGRVAHLAAIGRPHLRSPTSAPLSNRQRPSASGVRRHGHCPRPRPLPTSTPTPRPLQHLLFTQVESRLLLLLLPSPAEFSSSSSSSCTGLHARQAALGLSACPSPALLQSPSPPSLHASAPSVAAIRFAEETSSPASVGIHYAVLASAIRHTPP